MTERTTTTQELLERVKAAGKEPELALRVLRTGAEAAAANRRLPKKLRKELTGLVPRLEKAERKLAKKRPKPVERSPSAQVKPPKAAAVPEPPEVPVAPASVWAPPPVAGSRARKRLRRSSPA